MNREKLNDLKNLIYCVINSPTKKEAQVPLKRLELMVSSLNNELKSNQYNKLVEAMNYSKEASGQAQRKEHWISSADQAWKVFENLIKNDIED